MLAVLRLYARVIMTLVIAVCALDLRAQDPVFAQYYLNQNYLNPAFAGFTNALTTNVVSRAQYLRVPGLLLSHTASANISCEEETRLGLGAIAYHHIEGEGFLNSLNFSGQASINFPFKIRRRSRSNKGLIAAGIQLGAGQKYLNWKRLTFTDQYDRYTDGVVRPSNLKDQPTGSNIFLDAAFGVRGTFEYGSGKRPKFLSFGASAFHLNRPVQTFLNTEVPLEPRYSFYFFSYLGNNRGGRSKDLKYLTIGALADYQQGLQSHTLSIYKDANEYITAGISVRRQNFILIDRNVDAVIPHLVLYYENWTFGISYEWTVSSLGEEQTFGTAEIGVSYRFENTNLCRNYRKLCKVKGFDMGHDMPNVYF